MDKHPYPQLGPWSHLMRKHLPILASLLKAAGYKQSDVATILGYKSGSAVGMMLRGERPMGRGDLEKMCELAGITVISLASVSDDLHLAKRPESVEGAAILDECTPEELAAAMALLRAYRKNKVR